MRRTYLAISMTWSVLQFSTACVHGTRPTQEVGEPSPARGSLTPTGGSGDPRSGSADTPSRDSAWSTGLPTGPNGPVPFIVVDQFGYRTAASKVAVIRDPQLGYDGAEAFSPGSTYSVIEVVSGRVVKTGSPVAWNDGATDPVSGDRAFWFDFSDLTTPGSYYVRDDERGARSVHFDVSDAVYYAVLKHAVRTFYYQRAGFEKRPSCAGEEWADGASHLGPGQDGEARDWNRKEDPATARDLHGGWYDAGDYNKYTAWTAQYVIDLLRAYEQNPTAFTDDYGMPESGNGVPDILDEVKWGLEWLRRMQLDDGSVLCVMGLASGSPPSSATVPSYYGPPTTNASLATAAAFAYAAKVYARRREPVLVALAHDLNTRAAHAYSWSEANPAVTFFNNDEARGTKGLAAGQQEVDDDGRRSSKVAAAVYLYEQTEDRKYRDFIDANCEALIPGWGPNQWMARDQELLLYYSRLPGATPAVATTIRSRFSTRVVEDQGQYGAVTSKRDPYRAHINDYTWGSNASKASQGRIFQLIEAYGVDDTLAPASVAAAEDYAHYVHGVNPLGLVYLTNMRRAGAEHSAKTLYHTWFHHGTPLWDEVTEETPGPAPGLLVGGPNPSFKRDACCADGCFGAEQFAYCALDLEPPLAQPPMKSYLQYNESWPANSWEVTENSNGYQSRYILLLARYARR